MRISVYGTYMWVEVIVLQGSRAMTEEKYATGVGAYNSSVA